MTTKICGLAMLLGATALLPPAAAGPEDAAVQQVELLKREVRELRAIFHLFQVETLGRAIVSGESELNRLRERLRKLEIEERQIREDVRRMDLQAVNTPPGEQREENEELNASRELKPGSSLYRVLAEAEASRRKETELNRQLEHDRQRWQAALAVADAIQAETNRVKGASPGR